MATKELVDIATQKEIDSNKKWLHTYIDDLNEEQTEFVYFLFSLNHRGLNKGDIIKMFADGDIGTFDYAYPHGMLERIKDVYPDIDEGTFIFDYTEGKERGLMNLNNVIAKKIINFFSNLW